MKLGINLFVDSLPVNSTPKMTVKRIGPLKSIFKYNRLTIKVIHIVYNLYGLVFSDTVQSNKSKHKTTLCINGRV